MYKKTTVFSFTVMLPAVVCMFFAGCVSGPQFDKDVQGKEWRLIEVQTSPENIVFDRDKLIDEGFEDIFILTFDGAKASGKAAPNRYMAPYELSREKDKSQTLSIKPVAGTLMAPIREPERLKEREYFIYLENAYRWDFKDGKLQLYTKNDQGAEAVLVYTAG
jgi:heat shock protein HslJ